MEDDVKIITCILLFIMVSFIHATPYEGYIKAFQIIGNDTVAISVSVKYIVYQGGRYQVYTLNGNRFESSTNSSFVSEGYNGNFSVGGVSEGSN